MTVSVSVILPVYNRSLTLERACRSVLDQSYRDIELIVVDDASTEDLSPVFERLDDARVVRIRHEVNAGAAAARNTGLAAAKGQLIAFQDSDDLWLPGKLEAQVALLQAQPDEITAVTGGKIIYGIDVDQIGGPGRMTFEPDPATAMGVEDDQLRRTLEGNRISVQSATFRRDHIEGVTWFDPLLPANEDWDFAIRLTAKSKVLEDPEPVVLSYVSHDSISRNSRKKIAGHIRILKKNWEYFDRYPDICGRNLFALGRALSKIGKPQLGRPFIRGGLQRAPKELGAHAVSRILARTRLSSLRGPGA